MNKPEMTANAAAFEKAGNEYRQTIQNINSSYSHAFAYFEVNFYGDPKSEQNIETLAKNREALAVRAEWAARAEELAQELEALIAVGADVELRDYTRAVWQFREYEEAVASGVTIEAAAELVTKDDAFKASKSMKNRTNPFGQKAVRAVANLSKLQGVEFKEMLEAVREFAANAGYSYAPTTGKFVVRSFERA